MTIFGASKECIDKIYSIFSTNEIGVERGEDDLYDIIIPSTLDFQICYDSSHKDLKITNRSKLVRPILINTDDFVRLTII